MILNQSNYCLFILAICAQIFYETQSDDKNFTNGARFKSLKCKADNKTTLIKFCYLKAVSRKIVTFNYGVKLLVPFVKPFFGNFVVYYRYGTIYRQIIDIKNYEICEILDGGDTNPLIKLLLDMLKSRAPHLIHKCPYDGDWDLKNFTLNTELIDGASMFFPQGIYRGDFSLYINDSWSLNFSAALEVKSSIKESFG